MSNAKVSEPNGSTISQSAVDIKLVAIPVALIESLYSSEANEGPVHKERRSSFLKRMGDKYMEAKNYQKGGNTQFVRMPVNEYEKYWAKDGKGHYCGTEPEGCEEGKRLLKQRLEDTELQQVGKKDAEADIIRDWKPLKERTGWTHAAVSAVPGGL